MKLVFIGSAQQFIQGRSWIPSFDIYVDQDTNKYYGVTKKIPTKYIMIRDESSDFMLIKPPPRMLRVLNPDYEQEVREFNDDLEVIDGVDLERKTIQKVHSSFKGSTGWKIYTTRSII